MEQNVYSESWFSNEKAENHYVIISLAKIACIMNFSSTQ